MGSSGTENNAVHREVTVKLKKENCQCYDEEMKI